MASLGFGGPHGARSLAVVSRRRCPQGIVRPAVLVRAAMRADANRPGTPPTTRRARVCGSASHRGRLASCFPRFFIDRPIFAAVLSIIVTLAGGIALVHAADRAVSRRSRRRPCEVSAVYPGRANAKVSRRHRGRADRAAGQRRREHAVYVVAVHERRHLHADGHVRPRYRSEHAPRCSCRIAWHWPRPVLPELVQRRA